VRIKVSANPVARPASIRRQFDGGIAVGPGLDLGAGRGFARWGAAALRRFARCLDVLQHAGNGSRRIHASGMRISRPARIRFASASRLWRASRRCARPAALRQPVTRNADQGVVRLCRMTNSGSCASEVRSMRASRRSANPRARKFGSSDALVPMRRVTAHRSASRGVCPVDRLGEQSRRTELSGLQVGCVVAHRRRKTTGVRATSGSRRIAPGAPVRSGMACGCR